MGSRADAAPVVDAGRGCCSCSPRVASRSGMVQKSGCYAGELGRRRRALHAHVLLRPALPLHRARARRAELALLRRPAGAGPLRGDGVPGRHLLLRLRRRLGHPLADRRRPTSHARADQPAGELVGTGQVQQELRGFVIVNAARLRRRWRCSRPGCWPGSIAGGPGTPRPSPPRRRWCSPASSTGTCSRWSWSPARCGRGRAAGRWLTGVLIGLGTATKLYPLFLLGPIADHLPARAALPRPGRHRARGGRRVAGGQRAGVPHRPRRVEGVLDVQLRARRRPRLDLAGGQPGGPHDGDLRDHGQPLVLGALRRSGARRWRCSASGRRARRGSPSSASWSWPASCWSTRSTRRSTCSGCCRWRCWPGRAGATS